jgi:hypothetical protein
MTDIHWVDRQNKLDPTDTQTDTVLLFLNQYLVVTMYEMNPCTFFQDLISYFHINVLMLCPCCDDIIRVWDVNV